MPLIVATLSFIFGWVCSFVLDWSRRNQIEKLNKYFGFQQAKTKSIGIFKTSFSKYSGYTAEKAIECLEKDLQEMELDT